MKLSTVFALVAVVPDGKVQSFLFHPFTSFSSTAATNPTTTRLLSSSSGSNEETLDRLQREFGDMQKTLLDGLAHPDENDKAVSAELAQDMLEKAMNVAAVQRYQQAELLAQAQEQLAHARMDKERAHTILEQAQQDAQGASLEASLVEHVDEVYEDRERMRDMSVAHAARKMIQDAKDLEVESAFQEMETEVKMEDAEKMMHEFEQNEVELKETLQQLRQMKPTE
jgi:hypothetical protein